MGPYERKNFKRHFLWNYTSIHSQKIMHTSRKGLYQSCLKNCEISNFGFLLFYFFIFIFFFSFPWTWDHMGVKVANGSPLKEHSRVGPQNSCISLGRVSTKVEAAVSSICKFVHRCCLIQRKLQGQCYSPHMYCTYPPSFKLQYFSHYSQLFRVARHLETSALNDPKMIWTLRGERYHIYILLVPPQSQFHSLHSVSNVIAIFYSN